MQDITGKEIVDRMPVIISQQSGAQLIGIPKIENGTGLAMAEGVYDLLVDWKVRDKIVGMSFDTTATNTGQYNGTCAILERLLGKSLLWLACNHHVYEIMLRTAFESHFGQSSAPTVPMFDRFQKEWKDIDKTKYKPGIEDLKTKECLEDVSDDLIKFCKAKLKEKFARADYKELLQLTLIFLGSNLEMDESKDESDNGSEDIDDDSNVKSDGNITFREPGGTSQARWMAKILYVLKICLFRSEFALSSQQSDSIRDLSIFIVRIYVKTWTLCSIPTSTPKVTLNFIKDVHAYEKIDKKVSLAILDKMRRHLWYLGEETIALSFFDDGVSDDEKNKMRETLLAQPECDESTSVNRLIVSARQIELLSEYELHDFITENTSNFFKRFEISTDFLQNEPSEWNQIAEYKNAKEMLSNLQVVNDFSERGVKLMKDFNKSITKDEETKQFLLQVVSDYRQKYPSHSKKMLDQKNY